MMYPRLFVARQLLTDDGLVFVSIDDNELADLVLLMNEVFGEENRVAVVAWEKRFTRNNNARMFSSTKDSVLVYRRSERLNYLREERTEKADSIYSNPDDDPRGPWTSVSYVNPATKGQRPNLVYPIENPFTGEQVEHPTNAWKYERKQHERHVREERLYWGESGNHRYPRLKKFLSEVSDGMVPIDVWDHESTGTTDEGSKELEELFDRKVFDNPKPTRLVQRMLKMITGPAEGDVVLDFFAGSCATAEAVLRLNRADGGNRQFVMVQLPEVPEDGSTAAEAGFGTIAEIGKERIRRVTKKLESEKSELDFEGKDERTEDLGFRVFKLNESHYRNWAGVEEKDEGALLKRMEEFADPLLPGWEPVNVIWEVAIKEGFSLTSRVEYLGNLPSKAEMGPRKPGQPYPRSKSRFELLFRVTDDDREQSFLICLDEKLDEVAVKALGLDKDDLFVCRDIALTDDLAANLALQCRLKTI
jgi:adenine-specific DNA-methyltransferase